jgi:uncharacterized protein YndB with AHSA1/START domain
VVGHVDPQAVAVDVGVVPPGMARARPGKEECMATNVHEVWVGADSDTIFDALTTQEGLDGWWGPTLRASTTVGGAVEFDHGLPLPLAFEVVELRRPTKVVWRCTSVFDDEENPASEWRDQTFTFDVGQRTVRRLLGMPQDVAVLRLTNDGWPASSRWQAFCGTAWSVTLEDKLKRWCESGEPSSGMVGS